MIQNIIENYLIDKQKHEEQDRKTGKWHPSSFGRCYRYQYLQRQGVDQTNPVDALTLRVFSAGHAFHEWVQEIILKQLPDAKCEVLIDNHDDIIGHADIVIADEVIDIKTCKTGKFKYMQAPNYDVRVENFNYWLQIACYASILGKEKMRLCFVEKDNLMMKEYVQELKNWKDELEQELKTLRGYWAKQELPPAQPRCWGGKECNWGNNKKCGYYDFCYGRGEK